MEKDLISVDEISENSTYEENYKRSSRKNGVILSDNIVNDFLDKASYKRLSLREEIHLIKCSKLSFYDDATAEDRERYIRYFCEENPWFAEKLSLATTDEERQEVILKGIERSFEIRDKFIENFILLSASYGRKINLSGIPTIDLIQEGILGIIKALEKFDIEKEFKFSTYATNWIQQVILRYIDNSTKLIRVPVHQCEFIRKVLKTERELERQLGRTPALSEIAEVLDVSVEKVERAKMDNCSITSLNKYVGDEEDELGDFIADTNSEYEDSVINDMCLEEFRNILLNSNLSEREIEILYMRYGLYDGQRYTLEQVGKVYGITRERVRQIEAMALVSLRRNKDLIEFSNSYFDRNADKVYKKSV
ncbi:MAG: sigma-70 family RNA polymerase sigma factor [Bacilli bacterium]|nr:sigma-70 family RNA polymerase sigma factor [Bacilli bacterium]